VSLVGADAPAVLTDGEAALRARRNDLLQHRAWNLLAVRPALRQKDLNIDPAIRVELHANRSGFVPEHKR
jgi:hypothetical protein